MGSRFSAQPQGTVIKGRKHLLKKVGEGGVLGERDALGAGGGGFMLFYVPDGRRRDVKKALRNLIHVPFKFDDQGCQIVMYAPKDYPQSVYEKRDFIHMQQSRHEGILLKP